MYYCYHQKNNSIMKPQLDIPKLIASAKEFCQIESLKSTENYMVLQMAKQ